MAYIYHIYCYFLHILYHLYLPIYYISAILVSKKSQCILYEFQETIPIFFHITIPSNLFNQDYRGWCRCATYLPVNWPQLLFYFSIFYFCLCRNLRAAAPETRNRTIIANPPYPDDRKEL